MYVSGAASSERGTTISDKPEAEDNPGENPVFLLSFIRVDIIRRHNILT